MKNTIHLLGQSSDHPANPGGIEPVKSIPGDVRGFRLHGRWLLIARIVWVIFSVAAIGIFVIGTASLYVGTRAPCLTFPQKFQQEYCFKQRQDLDRLGLSVDFFASYTTLGVIVELFPWFIVGALIFWRKSAEPFELLFSLLLMIWGITLIDAATADWFVYSYHQMNWLVTVLTFLTDMLIVLWLLFPDGSFKPRWMRWVALLWLLRSVLRFTFPGTALDVSAWPDPIPRGIDIVLVAFLVYSLVYRYRRVSGAIQHQQIKWVVTRGIVYGMVYAANSNLFPFVLSEMAARLVWSPIYYGVSFLFAASLGFSILRYRLWDIDVIIRKTLIYGALTVTLVGVWLVAALLLQQVFVRLIGQESPVADVISTLAIVALFGLLRVRIQNDIDRRFYRKKYDAQKTLESFAASVRDEVELEGLTGRLLAVVEETMQPEKVSLWLKTADSLTKRTQE